MNIRNFKELLYTGDCRAIEELKSGKYSKEHADALLYACSHNTRQIIDFKYIQDAAAYLYEALQLFDNDEIIEKLIVLLSKKSDRKDIAAVCIMGNIIGLSAQNNSIDARVAIHDKFDSIISSFAKKRIFTSKIFKRDLIVAETMAILISDIDGIAGFLYVAGRYGRLMVKKEDACSFFPCGLWQNAKEKYNENSLTAVLSEYFDKMEYLKPFCTAAVCCS